MLPASFFSLISDLQSAKPEVIMVIPYCEYHVHTSLGLTRMARHLMSLAWQGQGIEPCGPPHHQMSLGTPQRDPFWLAPWTWHLPRAARAPAVSVSVSVPVQPQAPLASLVAVLLPPPPPPRPPPRSLVPAWLELRLPPPLSVHCERV